MKITKERLVEIIKEELQNTQLEGEYKKPSPSSDEYWEVYRDLNKKFGTTFQKIDGRLQRVETPAYKKLVKDLEKLGRQDVIDNLSQLSEVSIYMIGEVAYYVETNDMEGLDKMVNQARRHGQAVIDSGPLGT